MITTASSLNLNLSGGITVALLVNKQTISSNARQEAEIYDEMDETEKTNTMR